jgi:hypothetical protein
LLRLLSRASVIRRRAQVPARLHALVEHPHDLNETRPDDAVKQNMHGLSHPCLIGADACMAEMKASNAARQCGAVARCSAIRFGCNFAHRGRQQCRIAAPAFRAPPFCADSEDLRDIRSCQRRKTEARHHESSRAIA